MSEAFVTVVDTTVSADQEQLQVDGFRALNEGPRPAGLLRSELLRGQDGAWRIQSVWRDLEAVLALRRAGEPPAVLALLERIGAQHTHGTFTVEQVHAS